MRIHRRIRVISCLVIIAGICIAGISPGGGDSNYKNLKVLPKNISTKQLQQIMIDDFEDGLGVSCSFCHAKQKGSNRLDYASDEKPEKAIARRMMQMTVKLNKKYFLLRHASLGDSDLTITCNTCHRGQPHPDAESISGLNKTEQSDAH